MTAGRPAALLSSKRATTRIGLTPGRGSDSAVTVSRPRHPVALLGRLGVLSTISLIFSGGSCWAQSKQGANPPPPEKVEAPKVPQGPVDGATAPVDPRTYIIGPEDIINVEVWREPDFTKPHGVRPDGKITIPLIGDVQSAGLTPERLAGQLAQALKEFINDPQVTVSVQQVNSKKFYITGGVNKTGSYPLVLPTRVFDALSQAGGFREYANRRDIVIVRGDRRIKFNWDEVVKGKKLEQNIFLENGDTIIVKE
jgi:polysaccharide export outer membrane protein